MANLTSNSEKPNVTGFQPYGIDLSAPPVYPKLFALSTSNNALGVTRGDLVIADGTGAAKTISAGAYSGSSSDLLGVVWDLYDAHKNLIGGVQWDSSLTNGVTLTASTAGYCTVLNPKTVSLYLVVEDGDTTPIADASIGLNVAAIAAAASSGRSGFKIDSTSVNTTSTLPFRLESVHPDETGTAGTDSRTYIVRINQSAVSAGVAGA